MTFGLPEVVHRGRGLILVISAGTSDIPVAEEACLTARIMGNRVEPIYDVGVAGLHRLLAYQEKLQEATVFIVVAGMEGALPSVVGGLVNRRSLPCRPASATGPPLAASPPSWACSTPAPPGSRW